MNTTPLAHLHVYLAPVRASLNVFVVGRTIRWLHLSDFHVGKDDYAGRKLFEYMHMHVERQSRGGFPPDLLFVSGDLANKGKLWLA